MASPGAERTEKATPKRRNKGRHEGRVAKSHELNSTAVLIATLAALAIDAPRLLAATEEIIRLGLERAGTPGLAVSRTGLGSLTMISLREFGLAVAPVLIAAAAAGIITSVAQVGLHFSSKALKPSFKKLNLFTGLKRIFGVNQIVELGKSLSKILIVGGVAGTAFWSRMPTFGSLVGLSPAAI